MINVAKSTADEDESNNKSVKKMLQLNAKFVENYQHGAETHELNSELFDGNNFEYLHNDEDVNNKNNDDDQDNDDDDDDEEGNLASSSSNQTLQHQQRHYDDYEDHNDHMLEYHTEAAAETLNLLLPELQENSTLDCGNFSMDVDDFNTCLSNMFCDDIDNVEMISSGANLETVLDNTTTITNQQQQDDDDNNDLFNDAFQMHYSNEMNHNNDDDNNVNANKFTTPILLKNLPDSRAKATKNNTVGVAVAASAAFVSVDNCDSDSISSSSSSSNSNIKSNSNSGGIRSGSRSSLDNCGSYNGATFSVAASTTTSTTTTTSSIYE